MTDYSIGSMSLFCAVVDPFPHTRDQLVYWQPLNVSFRVSSGRQKIIVFCHKVIEGPPNFRWSWSTIEGRTVCESVTATVNPEEISQTIKREYAQRAGQIEEKGVDNNGRLKILRTFREQGFLFVIYEVIKPSGYVRADAGGYGVNVLYYSKDMDLMSVRKIHVNAISAYKGEVGTQKFDDVPPRTAFYKVFLDNW